MSNVVVSIPNLGWIHTSLVVQIIEMMKKQYGHGLKFNFNVSKPIDSSRNEVIRTVLQDKACDYLVFIDADNPPVRNPLELIDLDLDVIVLPTPIWFKKLSRKNIGAQPIVWNAMRNAKDQDSGMECWKEDPMRGGLREIDAGGSGGLVIARRVLEKVRPAFAREWDEDGVVVRGSDFLFCDKATKAGFKVWCHWDYYCQHWKEIDLAEVYKVMMERDVSHAFSDNPNTPEKWDSHWEEFEPVGPDNDPYPMVLSMLNGERKVLDFGCGRGELLAQLGDEAFGIDWSPKAIELVREQGLRGKVGTEPEGWWDCIICCDMLQTIDDDKALLKKFFEHTNKVIYAVPYDCLPPGLVETNRRVYTPLWIERITPHLRRVAAAGDRWIVVLAEKEAK